MQTSEPRLSIVIATYNAAITLEKCLSSISYQTFRDFELIIVDGLSTDGTIAIIEKHTDAIAYWHSHKDSGIYDAWNQGISKATGDYICFLGADDYFTDESSLLKIFSVIGNKNYDIVASQGKFLIEGGGHHIIGNPWNQRKLGKRITVCHPGLLHHRSLFERFGKFNTNFRIVGDYEFLLRLPPETTSLHVNSITVNIADGGISRLRYSDMLKEKREAQSQCPRVGKFKAAYNYYEKLCKIPIAKLLGLSY